MSEKPSKAILGAAGEVSSPAWGAIGGKIAVVRRHRYGGEVGLPKGKLNEGETDAEAALREVEEETGIRAVLRQPIGTTHYSVDGEPKTVTYFMMDAPDDRHPSTARFQGSPSGRMADPERKPKRHSPMTMTASSSPECSRLRGSPKWRSVLRNTGSGHPRIAVGSMAPSGCRNCS